jgi:tetratricopeptide (TPR) repeat protein
MKKSKSAAVVASLAVCALVTTPAHSADAVGRGILENGWGYVQYLFADGAASAALNNASKAAAGKSNVLGLGAARELQMQAEALMQQRDFLGADKTLRRALSLAPELVSTQAMLAVAMDGQGRRTEANTLLEALAQNAVRTAVNASAKADALAPVAAAYNSMGDPRRALQIYNELIAENVDSAAVHSGRGEALQRLDDDVAALASFQLASEVEPRFPNLELKRAQSLEKLGRNSEAENAYRVALQVDPNSAAARASVARLEGSRPATTTDLPVVATAVATVGPPAVVTAAVVTGGADSAVPVPAKEDATRKSAKKAAAERIAALNVLAEKMAATATATATATAAAAAMPAPMPTPSSAPKPTAEKAPSGEAQAAVLAQLGKWQAAWAGKEVDAYLGFYAKAFTPVKMNRAAWEADRRVKLNKPGAIRVSIVEPSFELEGGVLKVTFNQEYTSSNFRDKTRKRMDWVQDGGEWRIQREVVL